MVKYVNERFFDKESKVMYYLLGAFYPSYNPSANFNNKLVFRSSHKDLVEIVNDKLESEYAIVSDPRKNKNSHFTIFRSKKLRFRLEELGLVANKSKRKFPKNIHERYLSHFVRGFFDGQGIIYQNDRGLTDVVFYFNNSFLNGLEIVLRENAGVKRKNPKKRILRYAHEDSIKIHDFIYQDWNYIKENELYLGSKKRLFNIEHKLRAWNEEHIESINRRIEETKKLLLRGYITTEVSKAVGYAYLTGFYYFFKKYFGMTPGEWKRKNLVK